MATYSSIGANRVESKKVRQKRDLPPLTDMLGTTLLVILAIISLLALILPMVIIVIVSFGSGPILRFPPGAFSVERYFAAASDTGLLDSAKLSLYTSGITVLIDILLGVPAAIGIVRGKFSGKALLLGFLQSPMMIPGIVVGLAILLFVSYAHFNISVPLMILSHVVVTMPYVIRITVARMESANKTLEEAAQNLGANTFNVLRYILIPYLMPGIIGGSAFAFLLSFDQLPVSLFTAPIIYPPMPVYLFRMLLYTINPMVAAIATIQIILTLVIFVITTRTNKSPELIIQ
jgi:putative spermidine/putrescine transport system permease protein